MNPIIINALKISVPIFFITVLLISLYKVIAKRTSILAKINFRSLHTSEILRGAGIVFSWIFIFSIIYLQNSQYLHDEIILSVCLGGAVASSFGFLDDIFDIKAIVKLFLQLFLGVWILHIFCFDLNSFIFVETVMGPHPPTSKT